MSEPMVYNPGDIVAFIGENPTGYNLSCLRVKRQWGIYVECEFQHDAKQLTAVVPLRHLYPIETRIEISPNESMVIVWPRQESVNALFATG